MFDKITKGTIDGTKSAKDFTLKKWKKFIPPLLRLIN